MKKLLALFLGLFCLVGCGTETTSDTTTESTKIELQPITLKIANAEGEVVEEKPFLVSEFLATMEWRVEGHWSSFDIYPDPNNYRVSYQLYYFYWEEDGEQKEIQIQKENIFYVWYDLRANNDIHYKSQFDGTNAYTFIGEYYD